MESTNERTLERRKVERNGHRDGQTDGRVTQIGSVRPIQRRLASIESTVAHVSNLLIVPFADLNFTAVFDRFSTDKTHSRPQASEELSYIFGGKRQDTDDREIKITRVP